MISHPAGDIRCRQPGSPRGSGPGSTDLANLESHRTRAGFERPFSEPSPKAPRRGLPGGVLSLRGRRPAWGDPRGPGPLPAHCRGGVPGPSRAPVTTAHPSLSGSRPRCDMGPGGRPLPPASSLLGALRFGFLLPAVCLFPSARATSPGSSLGALIHSQKVRHGV